MMQGSELRYTSAEETANADYDKSQILCSHAALRSSRMCLLGKLGEPCTLETRGITDLMT